MYLQALLTTGARREELLALRWQDVDFKWKTLTIRDKAEGQRVIPLRQPARPIPLKCGQFVEAWNALKGMAG